METSKHEERVEALTVQCLKDPMWRLANLYYIQDKDGKTIKYKPNYAQQRLYDNLRTRNLVLKARQIGFSTGIDIFLLDCCLFIRGFHAGIVGDTEDTAADLFRTKIQFPYEHMAPEFQQFVNIVTANKSQYEFTNGSVIETGVTLRSGTCQAVHVSEFGKISVEHPDRADEIISGSLETVPIDGIAFIESTARGRGGRFYEYYQQAKKMVGKELTDLDYQLQFFPWYEYPEYKIDSKDVVIPARLIEYFAQLNAQWGVKLTPSQMAWYAKKELALGDKMKREYPSYADEAFEQSLEGAYFTKEINECRKAGRICAVPYDPALPVMTHWDLGHWDYMAIVFTQQHGQREMRVIDYFESNQSGFPFYAGVLKDRSRDYGYKYSQLHNAPHDIRTHELSGKTRMEMAAEVGIHFKAVPRIEDKQDAIELARKVFKYCVFDASKCAALILHLEEYSKSWDSVNGMWKPGEPAKSKHCHGADAYMTLAQGTEWPEEEEIITTPSNWTSNRRKF